MAKNMGRVLEMLFQRAPSGDIQAFDDVRTYLIEPQERVIGMFDFDSAYDKVSGQLVTMGDFFEQGRKDASTDGFRQISADRLFDR